MTCRTSAAAVWSGEWKSRNWKDAGCVRSRSSKRCQQSLRRLLPCLLSASSCDCGIFRASRMKCTFWAEQNLRWSEWWGPGRLYCTQRCSQAHRLTPRELRRRAGTNRFATSASRTLSPAALAARRGTIRMTLHRLAHCLTSFCEFRRVQGWKFGRELSGSGQASMVRGSVCRLCSAIGGICLISLCVRLSGCSHCCLAVYAGGVLVAGPWPALIDVQHLASSIEALRYSKLLPARMELLRRAEGERNADAALVR